MKYFFSQRLALLRAFVYFCPMKKRCNQFKHLLDSVRQHSDDVRLHSYGYATGTIEGYDFRLFQEQNIGKKNGTDDEYGAYLCIKDWDSEKGKWSAFYDKEDIDKWVCEAKERKSKHFRYHQAGHPE